MPDVKKIHLNLDQYEAEHKSEQEPFRFLLKGREIEITDPRDLDWQTLLTIDRPQQFARHCMSDEDRKFFLNTKISGRAFNELFTMFQEHYGLDTAGNGDA